jgi:hypothetical protein
VSGCSAGRAFRSGHQQLWLPQAADLYVELDGHGFYRRTQNP